MAITWAGTGTAEDENNTLDLPTSAITFTSPPTWVDGDLGLFICNADGNTDLSTYSSGWTETLDYQPAAFNSRCRLFVATADVASAASPPGTSFTFTPDNDNRDCMMQMVRLTGVDNSTPFDVTYSEGSHANDGNTASPSWNSITTNTDGALVVAIVGYRRADRPITGSAPTGWKLEFEEIGDAGRIIAVYTHTQATAGTVSGETISLTASGRWSTVVLALEPASTALEITPAAVSVDVAPGSVTVVEDQPVTPGAVSVSVTPGSVTVVEDQPVSPADVSIAVTPGSVTVAENQPITPGATSVTVADGTLSVIKDQPITPGAVALTVADGTLSVIEDQPITPNATSVTVASGTLTVTGASQDIDADGITATVAAGTMTITTGAVDITPDVVAVTVDAQAVTVAPGVVDIVPNAVTIDATPGALVITETLPITPEPIVVDVSPGELAVGFVAGVDTTVSIVRTIVVASELTLEIVGTARTVDIASELTLDVTGTARTIQLDPQGIINRE